jgi:hypothetical protein
MSELEEKVLQHIKNVYSELDNIYKIFKDAYDKNMHKLCVLSGEFLLKYYQNRKSEQYDEIKFLLSVCYYYIGNKTKGFELSDYIYLNKNRYHEFALKNLVYYVQKLNCKLVNISVKKPIDIIEWNLSNPSIVKIYNHEKIKYMINCRIVNYYEKEGLYFSKDSDGIVRTRNILLFLNENFEKVKQNEFICKYEKKKNTLVTGLEDVRLFSNNDIIYFTTVTYDNHNNSNPKISTGSYNVNDILLLKDEEPFYFNKLIVKNSIEADTCEKNWLPFTINHDFYVIYSFSPTIIMNVTSENNIIVHKNNYENKFKDFRGSAGPILFEYNDQIGYLTIIHEVIFEKFKDRWIRKYIHRFVWLDNNFYIKFISLPFYFESLGIEYCCGMISNEKEIILTIGYKDSNGFILICDKDEIVKLLFSIDKSLDQIL